MDLFHELVKEVAGIVAAADSLIETPDPGSIEQAYARGYVEALGDISDALERVYQKGGYE